MAEVKLRALGLREVDFGDFDRYLTALTEDGRRIEILCKNARRGKKQTGKQHSQLQSEINTNSHDSPTGSFWFLKCVEAILSAFSFGLIVLRSGKLP